jgi:hypothetical protein
MQPKKEHVTLENSRLCALRSEGICHLLYQVCTASELQLWDVPLVFSDLFLYFPLSFHP